MSLGVSESQSGSPRRAQNRPALNPVVLAQPLDVGDEVSSGVGTQINVYRLCQRPTASGPSLVE